MQKWIGIGNLTKDVEQISDKLAKLTLAIAEDYLKEDGTRPTQYFTIICWNKLAENCVKYLKKGSKVFVYGKLQNRTYEATDGSKKYVTEIIAKEIEFLSSPAKNSSVPEGLTPIEDDGNLPF